MRRAFGVAAEQMGAVAADEILAGILARVTASPGRCRVSPEGSVVAGGTLEAASPAEGSARTAERHESVA